MKILHVLSSNKYSGAENVVCQIIDMFNGEIEMAYCSPDGDIANSLQERNVKFLPMQKLSKKELLRVVEEYQPDIIHGHDLKAIFYVSQMPKKYQKVGHIHVNDRARMGKISPKSLMLRLIHKKFKHFFWVSNSCLEDFRFKKQLQPKSSVLYNIINTDKFIKKISEDEKNYDYSIVSIGRIAYQKNPIRMLQIAEKLKARGIKFKFAIIGSGDMEGEMKQYIQEHKLEDCVEMLGFLRNGYKILSQTKVALMTSYFEGTPMSALEYLALGKPIITTKTDGMMDLIKDGYNGYLYDTDEEAVDRLVELLTNDDKLNELSSNCVKFSQDYNNIESYKGKIRERYIQK